MQIGVSPTWEGISPLSFSLWNGSLLHFCCCYKKTQEHKSNNLFWDDGPCKSLSFEIQRPMIFSVCKFIC